MKTDATTAVYLWCPSCLDGRCEVDPSNPEELLECERCGHEWFPNIYVIEEVLESAGYSHSDRHGWRTDKDEHDDAPYCDGECCHPGVERRGRWD